MDDKISLTRKQINFLTQMLEIKDPQSAVERFTELMIEERVDPGRISEVINKIIKKIGF